MLGNDVAGETFPPTNALMGFALLKSQQNRNTTIYLQKIYRKLGMITVYYHSKAFGGYNAS